MAAVRILITGINGLIGGVLHVALREEHEVFGLDVVGPFSEAVIQADISEYWQVAEAIKRFSPLDAILHLAGNPRVKASWEEVLGANIIGTWNIFEAAREYGIPSVVFASSNHVTGGYEGYDPGINRPAGKAPLKILPSDPVRPDSEYGVSKAFGENLARYYFDRYGVKAICLRIGSVTKHDQPSGDPRNRKIWLSQRDLAQLVRKSLEADIGYGIYFGISDNKGAIWDITNARQELGYEPMDDSFTR